MTDKKSDRLAEIVEKNIQDGEAYPLKQYRLLIHKEDHRQDKVFLGVFWRPDKEDAGG